MDTYESREDGISRAAQELGDDVARFVERRLRPAVGIEFLGDDAESGPGTEGRTRFGGLPDLADDETWPVYDGPGLFVGQIDFAEIPEQTRESLREYVGRDIPAEDWPWQTWEESEPHLEFRASLHSGNYLFGYPDHTSLAYDPTPEGTIPLLTLFSEEDLEWLWADGDFLQVFVKPEALAAGEFGELLSDAG